MNKRRLWLLLASVLVLVEGYLLPAVFEVIPSLLAACLLITAIHYPINRLLINAVFFGLLLDVASMGWFGINILFAVTTAAGFNWGLRRGLDAESFIGVSLFMFLAVIWQNLLYLPVASLPASAPTWLAVTVWQAVITIVFAWAIKKSVKLKLWTM